MNPFVGYRCSICKREYSPGEVTYTCPEDGGNLDVLLDYARIKSHINPGHILSGQETSLWKYLQLLPLEDPGFLHTPIRAAGGTPVFFCTVLAQQLGLRALWIKDESWNPTASFKDRASAIVVARAQAIRKEVVITASTGNAGAALAGMAAAVAQKSVILAPKTAPPAKIAQLLVYGADVVLVDGNYDQAFDLSIEAAKEFNWYCRNTGYNPFTAEGKKTAAFEIWDWFEHQQFSGRLDDRLVILVSVGDGNIISGIHKGFKDLYKLGWIDRFPRIIGVQAEGSAAVARTFARGSEVIEPVIANTLADSISVDMPRDGIRAIRAAVETGGTYVTVSDQQILVAIRQLGKVGIFAEPAGATAYAGLVKAVERGVVSPDDLVMVINTGSGLKDVKAAMQSVSSAPVIEPSLAALKKVMRI